MDAEGLEAFSQEFYQDILAEADERGLFREDVFYDKCTEALEDVGEFSEAPRSFFQSTNNSIRVDGYCGDPIDGKITTDSEEPLTLGLIILDFHQGNDVITLTKTEMGKLFGRLLRYVEASLKQQFRSSLETSTPGFQLADLINTRWKRISKIRLYLLTNKVLSNRIDGLDAHDFQGREVVYSVWGLNRFHSLMSASGEREVLRVDFTNPPLHPLRALKASAPGAETTVYLTAIPGEDLARIYDRWGARLLEQNVRVFLQARSNVNKGIKRTIENEPELFFSFNNGLTATAESVATQIGPNGLEIASLENLQIVNGGQTTASLYAAYRAKRDLSKIYVQMKLSIVDAKRAEDLVPRISEYANSQNKVTTADLFANHPFHTRMEMFSRHEFAPPKEGAVKQTKWFYERARGQYNDQQAYLTRGEKNKFRAEFPKNQVFSKTDLAKYLMVWTDTPYVVCRGAQKNFVEFAKMVTDEWKQSELGFNKDYFQTLVAKKIVFDATESIIPRMDWYEAGGYRAQHVALTIGILAEGVRRLGKRVDFQSIWRNQAISPAMSSALRQAADVAHDVLMHPASGYRNITEWAKRPESWQRAKSIHVDWNPAWLGGLISPEEERSRASSSSKEQVEVNGIEAQRRVVYAGPRFWRNVQAWLLKEREASDKEMGCVRYAVNMLHTMPSDKQAIVLVRMMERIEKEGCPYRLPESPDGF